MESVISVINISFEKAEAKEINIFSVEIKFTQHIYIYIYIKKSILVEVLPD
jgi:hypothetical protein